MITVQITTITANAIARRLYTLRVSILRIPAWQALSPASALSAYAANFFNLRYSLFAAM